MEKSHHCIECQRLPQCHKAWLQLQAVVQIKVSHESLAFLDWRANWELVGQTCRYQENTVFVVSVGVLLIGWCLSSMNVDCMHWLAAELYSTEAACNSQCLKTTCVNLTDVDTDFWLSWVSKIASFLHHLPFFVVTICLGMFNSGFAKDSDEWWWQSQNLKSRHRTLSP